MTRRSALGSPRWLMYVIVGTFLVGGVAHSQRLTENAGVISPATPTVWEALRLRETEHLTDLRLNHQLPVHDGDDWRPDTPVRVRATVEYDRSPTLLHVQQAEQAGQHRENDDRLRGENGVLHHRPPASMSPT